MIKTAFIIAPLFVCYLIHVVAEQDSSGIGSISSKLAQYDLILVYIIHMYKNVSYQQNVKPRCSPKNLVDE